MDITIHIPELDKLSTAIERLAAIVVATFTAPAQPPVQPENPTAATPAPSAPQPFMAPAPASAAPAIAPIAPTSTTPTFFTAPPSSPNTTPGYPSASAAGFTAPGFPAQHLPTTPAPVSVTPNASTSIPSQGFPLPLPGQTAPAAPAASSNPAPQQAPITAPQYTIDDLARAASAIADMGKDVPAVLTQFGIKMLTELPKEQYGAFATILRQMGARI